MKEYASRSRSLRLFLLFSLLLLLALFISTLAVQTVVNKKNKELVYHNSMDTMLQFSRRIDEATKNVANGMVQYLYDSDIRAYVASAFAENDYTVRMRTREKLSNIRNYSSIVESAAIYSVVRNEVLANQGVWERENYFDPVLQSVQQFGERAVWTPARWIYDPLARQNKEVISVLRAIGSSPQEGVLILTLSAETLREMIRVPGETGSFSALANEKGEVLAVSNGNGLSTGEAGEIMQELASGQKQGMMELTLHNEKYHATFSQIESNGWTLMHLVPFSALFSDIQRLQKILTLIFTSVIVLQVLLIAAIGKTVALPFVRVASTASHLFGNKDAGKTHEADYLDDVLHKMLKENQELAQAYRENLGMAADRYVQRLLERSHVRTPSEITEGLTKHGLEYVAGSVAVAAISVQCRDWKRVELIKLQFVQMLRNVFTHGSIITAQPSANLVAVVFMLEGMDEKHLSLIENEINVCLAAFQMSELTVAAGLSLPHNNLCGISSAWTQARHVLDNQYLHGPFRTYVFSENNDPPIYPAKLANAMIQAAKAREAEKISLIIDELLAYYQSIPDCCYTQMLDQLCQITVISVRNMVVLWPELEKEADQSLLVYSEFRSKHFTLPQIRERMFVLFENLFAYSLQQSANPNQKMVEYAVEMIHQRYMNDLSLDDICQVVSLSPQHFNKIFRKYTGTTFVDYLIHYRITMASQLLQETNLKVKEIAVRVGFNSQDYFTKVFRKEIGMSPMEYRKLSIKL